MDLVREPSIHVAHRQKPTWFFVIGERCSGTNFLHALIVQNTELLLSNEYGWKHGFPSFPAVSADTIAFVIVRNALDWVRSLYGRPWHAAPMIREIPFREFIRARWDAIVDLPAHFALPDDDPRAGEILQYDRHPITGRAFRDILELRNQKMAAHLGMGNRAVNVVLCSHEYISQEPEGFIERIGNAFALFLDAPVVIPKGHFGWPWPREIRDVALPPVGLEAEDRAYVLSRLDLAQEARAGYHY